MINIQLPDGSWSCPPSHLVLKKAGLFTIKEYIQCQVNTFLPYIQTCNVYSKCHNSWATQSAANHPIWWAAHLPPPPSQVPFLQQQRTKPWRLLKPMPIHCQSQHLHANHHVGRQYGSKPMAQPPLATTNADMHSACSLPFPSFPCFMSFFLSDQPGGPSPCLAKCQPRMEFSCCMAAFLLPQGGVWSHSAKKVFSSGALWLMEVHSE